MKACSSKIDIKMSKFCFEPTPRLMYVYILSLHMSKLSGGSQQKIRCLSAITKKLMETFPEEISYEKMQLWIRVNLGLSQNTAKQYLDDVLESRGWVLDGDVIKAEI